MKLTSSATARRSASLARSRSGGSPQTPGPVIRIAPKPSRFTVRSPPTPILPAAAAVGIPFIDAPFLAHQIPSRPVARASRVWLVHGSAAENAAHVGDGRAHAVCHGDGSPERQEMITMMPTRAPAPVPPQPAGQVSDLLPLGDWARHHSLRSWPVLLFLALICVPSIALLILGLNPSGTTFDHVAWIFAAYFAVAWLLLLGVIIRPEHVPRSMLVLVTAIALATQVPLAVTLEADLHAETAGLGPSIYSVGLPEELAKAIPVLAVALIYRLWRQHQMDPRDYLFLGAVSGLVFGASEVVHYFTVNGVAQFYLTVQAAMPSIQQLILTGHSVPDSLFAVLIGPVRYFILEFVWRFVTAPISHAS